MQDRLKFFNLLCVSLSKISYSFFEEKIFNSCQDKD